MTSLGSSTDIPEGIQRSLALWGEMERMFFVSISETNVILESGHSFTDPVSKLARFEIGFLKR